MEELAARGENFSTHDRAFYKMLFVYGNAEYTAGTADHCILGCI